MNDWLYGVGAAAGLIAAYVAWRKLRPETRDITVTSANKVTEMSLRFATAAGNENDQLVADIRALRDEFNEYKAATDQRITDLTNELSTEREEKQRVKRENVHLIRRVAKAEARVSELEVEVARLSNGTH